MLSFIGAKEKKMIPSNSLELQLFPENPSTSYSECEII